MIFYFLPPAILQSSTQQKRITLSLSTQPTCPVAMTTPGVIYTKQSGYWDAEATYEHVGRFHSIITWFATVSRYPDCTRYMRQNHDMYPGDESPLFVPPANSREDGQARNAIKVGLDLLYMNRTLDMPVPAVFRAETDDKMMYFVHSPRRATCGSSLLVQQAWQHYVPTDVYSRTEVQAWLVKNTSGHAVYMMSSTFDEAFEDAVISGGDRFWDRSTNTFGDITPLGLI